MRILQRLGPDGERGTMSIFFVLFTIIVFLLAGLVIDGGNAIAGRERAGDEAEQAARAGAEQIDIDALRNADGTVACPSIDQAASTAAIRQFVSATGDTVIGVPSYSSAKPGGPINQVSVTVQVTTALPLLGAVGLSSIKTTGSATAGAVPGIGGADRACT